MLLLATRAAGLFTDGALSPCRSTPDIPPCVTFDESLLEEGEPLEPGELQLNELTVESVQHTCVVAWHRVWGPGGGYRPDRAVARWLGLLGSSGMHLKGTVLTLPFLWAQADLCDR